MPRRLPTTWTGSAKANEVSPAGSTPSPASGRAQRALSSATRSASSDWSVAATAYFAASCPLPSVMRINRLKISPAGVPSSALGTGSAGGRTRARGLNSTAVTACALDATQRPSASSL